MATATNPPSATPSQGSSDDRQIHDPGVDPEDSRRSLQRPVSAPSGHGDMEDTGTSQTARVPQPRQSEGRAAPVTNQVPVTLTAGPDGALWITVDGVDAQQLAAKISALCDVLTPGAAPVTARGPIW
jgi:hypothetical protein